MAEGKFGTSINCIDGRTQIPVSQWIKDNYSVDYVDMVNEPGCDKLLPGDNTVKIEEVKAKALISVNAHKSSVIVVAGHHDCAGNPISKEEHISQIKQSVDAIKAWGLSVEVAGVWVNDQWQIEKVQ